MSWWDSIVDTVVDVGGDLYNGATQVIGDQYENYQKTVNSDNAKNVENLKQNEPMKGNTVDGSTTVAVTGAGGQQAGVPVTTNQLIAGVDNKLLFIGGAIVAVLLLKK